MPVSVISFWGANRWVAAAQTSVLHPHEDQMAVIDSVQGDVSRKRRMPQGQASGTARWGDPGGGDAGLNRVRFTGYRFMFSRLSMQVGAGAGLSGGFQYATVEMRCSIANAPPQ
jgi:hypothetical protein